MSMGTDKSIWMGSNGYGICKDLVPKQIQASVFDKENGFSHNTVFVIVEDENGLIWISTHMDSC